jgi:hypothetical protein
MKNKTTIVIVAQIIIIIILIWVIVLLGKKNIIGIQSDEVESEEEIIIDYTTVINGIKQIQLPTSVEKNSNIQYTKLKQTQINQKKLNYGIVQNMGPLVSKRTNLARVNLEALKALNEDNKNISDLTISKKEIEISDLENQKNIYEYEKTSILSNIKQEWGPFFVSAVKDKNDLLNRILKNKNQLISLSVTQGNREELPPESIVIIPSISNTSEVKASFLSSSPMVNPSIVGKNFFYYTKNNKLTIGERISAYVSQSNYQQNHLLVPNSSVIWSNGQPWAFIRIKSNGNFERRSLQGMREAENGSENGWIVPEGKIKIDDEIVTNGAQLLLSEEFKYQIKNENED